MNRPGTGKLRRCVQIALAALAIAAPGVEAQQDRMVASLKQVTGNVLVSQPSGLGAGSEAQRLANGTRVITTAKSTVIVAFDNGCDVELKENQRFEVDSDRTCAALLAGVQGIVAPVAAAPVLLGAVLPAVATGGGFALIQRSRENQAVSPN